jgi:AbrB family looped-hinge helix DNA binding protein
MVFGILNGMKLTFDKAGRIVVPKPVRDRFGWVAGTEIEAVVEPDGLRLRVTEPRPLFSRENGVLVCAASLP